ncbi:MAG: adenylosuccinate lyase [Planctomycetes bacterium]|nr:adenylosuccinate lyase [Planctomycetota bacterium]
MSDSTTFNHPLVGRYAAKEMRDLFSDQRRIGLWRRLWLALAETQRELGLTQVTEEAISQMKANLDNIDFKRAAALEKDLRHDVMAHVHTFAEAAPAAKAIIHLGATSCFVTDNADLILMREGLRMILQRLTGAIAAFDAFARREAKSPCLGYTHFQVAQPTTIGKRACLWLQDLLLDHAEVQRLYEEMPLRGVKGTTGTQASFLELFDGNERLVVELEKRVGRRMGFAHVFGVTGQTYTRKYDHMLVSAVAGIGVSAQKLATDIRLLMGLGELDEPTEEKQIGSSAMAYKRNPMRSERVCSISRYLISLPNTMATTAAEQWLERTLDDSAIRRMVIPETFLAADIVLSLLGNIGRGLKANHAVINSRLARELPLMATEAIIMAAVRAGGDRQAVHEAIRVHSRASIARIKQEGAPDNDLISRLKTDVAFAAVRDQLDGMLEPARFVGRAPAQCIEFLDKQVAPLLVGFKPAPGEEITV